MVKLEDAQNLLGYVDPLKTRSPHMTLLVNGLHEIASKEAIQALITATNLSDQCRARHLKKLECEAMLLSLFFGLTLRDLGGAWDSTNNQDCLRRMRDLCYTFPDTAGILRPSYEKMYYALQHRGRLSRMLSSREIKSTLWTWPVHRTGALSQCLNHHLFSASTSDGCPECGREVPLPESAPLKPLQDDDFALAIRSVNVSFDEQAYRK